MLYVHVPHIWFSLHAASAWKYWHEHHCNCFKCISQCLSRLHDFDNNTLLDGLEMYKALTHMLPYEDIQDHLDEDRKPDKSGKTAQQIEQDTKAAQTSYYMGKGLNKQAISATKQPMRSRDPDPWEWYGVTKQWDGSDFTARSQLAACCWCWCYCWLCAKHWVAAKHLLPLLPSSNSLTLSSEEESRSSGTDT